MGDKMAEARRQLQGTGWRGFPGGGAATLKAVSGGRIPLQSVRGCWRADGGGLGSADWPRRPGIAACARGGDVLAPRQPLPLSP